MRRLSALFALLALAVQALVPPAALASGYTTTVSTTSIGALKATNNLSDVASTGTSRTNLGLGTAATQNTAAFLQPSNNLSDVASASTALANIGGSVPNHPGYIAANWYQPVLEGTLVGGAAIASGSIRLLPFCISRSIRVQALAVRVVTTSAGGNVQAALYTNNAATGRPTGTALASTASMSTASAAAVSASVTPVTLAVGCYWEGVNQDNAVAAYTTLNAGVAHASALIGSATLANVTSATATASLHLVVAQTFGTWPDLTSATITETAGNTASALVFLQAA